VIVPPPDVPAFFRQKARATWGGYSAHAERRRIFETCDSALSAVSKASCATVLTLSTSDVDAPRAHVHSCDAVSMQTAATSNCCFC
jgi:hypothetical protein